MKRLSRFLAGALVVSICPAGWPQEAAKKPDEGAGPPVVHGSLTVTAETIDSPAVTKLGAEETRSTLPLGDGSEVLRGVTGADLGRMGGHGLEPFIRGQSQGDITVLLDGATVHGGCPNRMDPPTSFATAETTDRVVVIRGVQTLRYGAGAPGGTVLYDRQAPLFADGTWSVDLSTGGSIWSESPELAADASVGLGDWSFRALAFYLDSGSYEDGSGAEVRSAARTRSSTLMAGWRPDADTVLELSYEIGATDDALFAGAGMDAPEDRTEIVRAQTERAASSDRLGWRLDAFFDSVEHLMDNYSLRPLTAPMAMKVPSETSTWGFRGHLELAGTVPLLVGAAMESADADATRLAGPAPDTIGLVQSIMWPDVTRGQAGAFVEGVAKTGAATRLVYGFRVDHFTAKARRADEATGAGSGPTPRQLWTLYSGSGTSSWSRSDFGGLLRLEHRVDSLQLYAGLSRTVRPPDASERYLASNSAMPARRWVGNPELDTARFHQLDLGAGWSGDASSVSLTAFAADIGGHILRDRAHGQSGINQTDGATIYRNVAARRYGAELDALLRLSDPLVLSGNLAWVWAQNTSDDRPIAQTPPLHGTLSAAWTQSRWAASGTVRWAAKQTRVDDDPTTGSGLDAGPTPGWAVLDLAGSAEIGAGFSLQVGIANLFDRTYANHLNRDNLFDPDPIRVNEPGRTAWLRLRWHGQG